MRLLFLSICACLFAQFSVFSQDLESIGKQKPIKFGGGLSLFADAYSSHGIPPRSTPFNWRLTGSPTVTIYGISFPFYFNIGSQERSFTQPFNQYGVSPRYKWITAHLGWRNLSYSQYSLAGLSFYGAALELNPGKFRFSAMYGRFNKAVREDTTQQFIQATPTYKRIGYSARIGVGTPQNFFDLIFFKAQDDSTSYKDHPQRLKPAENAVFGINSKFLLFKHVQLNLDAAASAYTRNIQLDSISDPQFKKFASILNVNASSQLLYAGNASIGYVSKYINLKLQYKRVSQDYKSMGAYMYQTDLESYTIEPSFNLFKNKVRINGSFGKQNDNLSGKRLISNLRTIGSVGLSINVSKTYGVDLQYGNYGIAQRAGIIPINDTIRMAIANQNINLMNRFTLMNKKRAMSVILLTTYQEMTNLNPLFPAFVESKVMLGNLNVNYLVIPTGINFSGGFNYTRSQFGAGTIVSVGPILGVGKTLFKSRLNTSINTSLLSNKFDGKANGTTITGGLNLTLRINKSQSLLGNIRFTSNSSNNPLSVPFTEVFFSAGYQFNLH